MESRTEDVSRGMKAAVEKLTAEAERLKKLCEVRALKENPVELSVDKPELIKEAKLSDQKREDFADAGEMIDLLRLFSVS